MASCNLSKQHYPLPLLLSASVEGFVPKPSLYSPTVTDGHGNAGYSGAAE